MLHINAIYADRCIMTARKSALDASSFWALAPPHLVFPDVSQEMCLICSHDDKY